MGSLGLDTRPFFFLYLPNRMVLQRSIELGLSQLQLSRGPLSVCLSVCVLITIIILFILIIIIIWILMLVGIYWSVFLLARKGWWSLNSSALLDRLSEFVW